MDYSPTDSSVSRILQAKNTGVGCHFLLQEIFLTPGTKPTDRFFTTVPSGKPITIHRLIKVVVMARMKGAHELSNVDFHPPRPSWPQTLLRAQTSSSRDTLSPWCAIVLCGHQQTPWGHADDTGQVLSWRKGIGCHWNRPSLCVKTSLPCTQRSCQHYPPGTYKMPHSTSWYSTHHGIWPRNSCQGKWSEAMGPANWTHCSHLFPNILKQLAWQNAEMAFWRFSYSTS